MKNKKIVTLALAGMMTISAFSGALAAGLGVIDMGVLVQQHPNFQKAQASWQADLKSAQTDFNTQVKTAKTDKEKQALSVKFAGQLNQQRVGLFAPIEKDIIAKTQQISKQKGLDYVVLKGAVVVGTPQDITQDVAQTLK